MFFSQERSIGTFGGPSSAAFGISQQGEVAGRADVNADTAHAFFLRGALQQDLGILPLPNLFPFGGLTVSLCSARAIGGGPVGATVVGVSGIYASPAGLTVGVPPTVIERAFSFFPDLVGSAQLRDLGTMNIDPITGASLGNSQARGVNALGHVVGVADTPAISPLGRMVQRAFFLDLNAMNPTMVDIGTLFRDPLTGQPLGDSEAYGINDRDQIVGVSDTGSTDASGEPIRHAFVHDINTGVMQDLSTLLAHHFGPGQTGMSEARAINNRGQITGISQSLDGNLQPVANRAFLFDPFAIPARMMRDLGTLSPANRPQFFRDFGESEGYALDVLGNVVGMADTGAIDASGQAIRHAFRWDVVNDLIEDLHDAILVNPGAVLEAATGIDDSGRICAALRSSGHETALLLIP